MIRNQGRLHNQDMINDLPILHCHSNCRLINKTVEIYRWQTDMQIFEKFNRLYCQAPKYTTDFILVIAKQLLFKKTVFKPVSPSTTVDGG